MITVNLTNTVDRSFIIGSVDSSFEYKGPGIYRFEILIQENRVTACEYMWHAGYIFEVMDEQEIKSSYFTPDEVLSDFMDNAWSRMESNYYSVGIPYGLEHRYYSVS